MSGLFRIRFSNASLVVIFVTDWLALVVEIPAFVSIVLIVPIEVIIGIIVCLIVIVLEKLAGSSWKESVVKGLIAGIVTAIPTPVTGTIYVLILLVYAIIAFAVSDTPSFTRASHPHNNIPQQEEDMLDPASLTILLKVLDFLFDEGRKILEERRERRKISGQVRHNAADVTNQSDEREDIIRSKESALEQKVAKNTLHEIANELAHLLTQRDIYIGRYHHAKEQYAIYGSADAPYKIIHDLEESERGIEETMRKLRDILVEAYGKDIAINILDGD